MQSEVQEAKVKLGPLTCHQDANSISKNSELENIKKVINGCLIKTCLNEGRCMGVENDFNCSCPPGTVYIYQNSIKSGWLKRSQFSILFLSVKNLRRCFDFFTYILIDYLVKSHFGAK